jgi:ATP-dependent Clp protease ATP-binding subunit ClpC
LPEDILRTVADSAKIPIELLSEKTALIPNQVKSKLSKKLIGQEKVIESIHKTLLRRSGGVSDPNRPLGSFLFIGASGVGKTLTAKILADSLSPIEQNNNLVQINMSEFMEKHSISKFLGAPAGYVGYDEDKSLTEKIRQNPYSVVLFDEIEKADQNILNILLQILDEGKITDAKGRIINFKNTIIILTSNLGTSELNHLSKIGFNPEKKSLNKKIKFTQEKVEKELSDNLSKELLNRLDNLIIFNHLNKKDLEQIAKNEIGFLIQRLKERNIQLKISKQIFPKIAHKSADPTQGSRLIKKEIEKELEPLVADLIINKDPKKISLKIKNKKIIAE